MKKFTLLLLMALALLLPAQADNYFTVGENGTLRINPNLISGCKYVPVRLHLDGRIDSWTVTLTYPSGLVPTGFFPSTDVTSIPYQTSDGILNITDINLLINILNSTNGLEGMDCYDDPIASILGNSGTFPLE